MDAACAQMTNLEGVVLGEDMLNPERPLDGVRQVLVGNESGGQGPGLCGSADRQDAAVREKVRGAGIQIGVDGGGELRRQRQNFEIVVSDVSGVIVFNSPKSQTKNFAPRAGFDYSP